MLSKSSNSNSEVLSTPVTSCTCPAAGGSHCTLRVLMEVSPLVMTDTLKLTLCGQQQEEVSKLLTDMLQ